MPPGGAAPAGRDYLSLRKAAAAYMRQHPDDYAPFVLDGDAEGGDAADGCVILCRAAPAVRALMHCLRCITISCQL